MAVKDDYQEFKNALNDLRMNSKPLINFLTILAGEKTRSAQQIVRAIEERILESPGDLILPAFYVLDSIVKNLRTTAYVQLFEAKLPVLFARAFEKVDEHTRSAMFKLRQTWPPVFTNLSLYNLDTRAHDIDHAWPILARVPDPPPFFQNVQPTSNSLDKNSGSTATMTSSDQQSISDDIHKLISRLQQENSDTTTFRTRTVIQPPISLAPPSLSELTARSDSYHAISSERMEQIRKETAHVLDTGVDGCLQSKIKKLSGKKKKTSKKRRPSARLRRRHQALLNVMKDNGQEISSDSDTDEQNDEQQEDDNDEDDDDEPFVIKRSSVATNGCDSNTPTINPHDNTNNATEHEVETLFGGTDKDYRGAERTDQQSTTEPINLDADSIFDINSKCLRVAEQKYKSNELSSEEYQETLKLLQNILESEVKRLTIQQSGGTTLLNAANQSSLASPTNSLPTTPSHPFKQLFQFPQQHVPHIPTISPQPSLSTFPNPPFPFASFGTDIYHHVMQIFRTVGAPSSYMSHYSVLPFLPPPPPAPPSFSLLQNPFQSPATSAEQQGFADHQSSLLKRQHDENNNSNNSNLDGNEENKRPRYDPVTGRAMRPRNDDDENVALVPTLIDANVNMLKRKYVGIAQQLFIGKFQCRLCGLRFTSKQKNHYAHHLDWHYLENKQQKDLNTSVALMQRSRAWYPLVQEWTTYEENIEEQIRTEKLLSTQPKPKEESNSLTQVESVLSTPGVISCPAIGNDDTEDDRCYVCRDPFENFFDDNREEWHLKDAIRVDGKTYHPICYQDVH